MQHRLTNGLVVIATTLTAALAAVPAAAAAEYAETWHLKSLLAQPPGRRRNAGHALVLRRRPKPTDPCGVSHTESGEQLITIRRPDTNTNLTFHPSGTVTPATFTVPARLRRSATLTEDYSQIDPHRCPGVGTGTGTGTGGIHTTNFADIRSRPAGAARSSSGQ